tara:strand:- start:2295 stop:3170 length:876 start_codon:yes stop_codon:yes gene_type:complete
MAQKIKHSKVKNTGLIFEFLLRQITADVLDKKDDSVSVKTLKTRFSENTQLGKELALYNILISKKFTSDRKADYFINEVMVQRSKLNKTQLRREKYNLIKHIKETYDVKKFFSSSINNYKAYAAIYKLFEYTNKLSPEQKTESYFTILEHVTTNDDNNKLKLNPKYKELNEDQELRLLTYKTLLERFNKKYSNDLDGQQKSLLRAYINNISGNNSLKEYIESKIPSMKSAIKKYSKNVKDDVVKIKLKEAVKSMDKFLDIQINENIKDKTVIQMMRYYELIKGLKKNGKKS